MTMEVTVWKCDGCGKIIDRKSDVYRIKLESLPFRVMGDPEARLEVNTIDLDFCYSCALKLIDTLKKIAEGKNETRRIQRIS